MIIISDHKKVSNKTQLADVTNESDPENKFLGVQVSVKTSSVTDKTSLQINVSITHH